MNSDAARPLKCLFLIANLPRPTASVRGVVEGREPLSGSLTSFLLVIETLARRGHEIGAVILEGGTLTETAIRGFDDLGSALDWLGDGRAVWCSWGDHHSLDRLNGHELRPWMWTEIEIDPPAFEALDDGRIAAALVVSDFVRLTLLHTRFHGRIGRVYNPLNPFFATPVSGSPARYLSPNVAFAGHLGESKGAQRVLEMWPIVRETLPEATLTLAGSARLYGAGRCVGPLGVAAPEFERQYLEPLVARFGSLEAAGLRLPGLLTPAALRELYDASALGIVNPNWDASLETFCCAATEMLARALPVVSVARGAFPETIGRSEGARLVDQADPTRLAEAVVELLGDPAPGATRSEGAFVRPRRIRPRADRRPVGVPAAGPSRGSRPAHRSLELPAPSRSLPDRAPLRPARLRPGLRGGPRRHPRPRRRHPLFSPPTTGSNRIVWINCHFRPG